MATVTLTHTNINSGNPVRIICSGVNVGYSKTNANNPNANYSADTPVVRVQSQSIANPIYALQNVKLNIGEATVGGQTVLTEELLKDFFVLANDDSDPIILNVTYGSNQTLKSLHKYSSARTANIPVTFDGKMNFNLDVNDSKDAYMPIVTITLVETKSTA